MIKVTSLSKKDLFILTTTPIESRPTSNARRWPEAPLTGTLNAYIVEEYDYKGRPAYQSYLKVDGVWYKTSSAHVRFLMNAAHEAFGEGFLQELTSVKLYRVPTERGDAAELEFNMR